MIPGLLASFEGLERLQEVEGRPFLPLVTLESGMVFGLVRRGEDVLWARAHEGVLVLLEPGFERRFIEWFEQDRDAFEDRIAEAATAAGLDGRALADVLPAVPLLQAVLAEPTPMVCRLALGWVLPVELRALRGTMMALAGNTSLPKDVRDRAERMVVPDHETE